MNARGAGGGSAGFSLIEMLVSTAVTLTVMGSVFGLMRSSQGSSEAQEEAAELQQRVRMGSELLSRELVSVGAGVSQGAVTGPLNRFFAPILPRRNGALSPDPPTVFRADAITVTYTPPGYSQTTNSKPLAPASLDLEVTDQPHCPGSDVVCGLAAGSDVLIFDNTGRFDTFRINTVAGAVLKLLRKGQSPTYTYEAGSSVARIVSYTYFRDATTNQLVRDNGGLSLTPIVDDVVDMQVSYFGNALPPRAPRPPVGTANCLYDAAGNYLNLPVLPTTDGSLAALTPAMLTDGPFCGTGTNQYDPDLLRVSRVRVLLRIQVGSAAMRGLNERLWKNPGLSRDPVRAVPDYTVMIETAPRNLNLAR